MNDADHIVPQDVDRSTILTDFGQVISESSTPEWINKLPIRERSRTIRALGILATLARDGPLSEQQVVRQSHEKRSSVLRSLKLLTERDMAYYKPGERGAKIFDVTSFGLFYCFMQHFLSSEEFVGCIAKRSKLVSILLGTEDVAFKKLIGETAKLAWAMAYYESIHSTLAELENVKSKHETERVEDAHYFELIRGIGSIETLEWALMTRLLEAVGVRALTEAIKRLKGEERAEIRDKLIVASRSHSSARSELDHVIRLLNRTILIFGKQ